MGTSCGQPRLYNTEALIDSNFTVWSSQRKAVSGMKHAEAGLLLKYSRFHQQPPERFLDLLRAEGQRLKEKPPEEPKPENPGTPPCLCEHKRPEFSSPDASAQRCYSVDDSRTAARTTEHGADHATRKSAFIL